MKVSHKKLNTGVSSEQLSILSRLKLYFFEIFEISYFEHKSEAMEKSIVRVKNNMIFVGRYKSHKDFFEAFFNRSLIFTVDVKLLPPPAV